ncbi:MAG TPA: PQQ-binding-like beta-propeller repeat protein [Gaiellales bacterium]
MGNWGGWTRRVAAVAGAAVALVAASATQSGAVGDSDTQSQYLHDPAHSSFSTATAITPANAGTLALAWHWHPDAPAPNHPRNDLYSSPAVVNGVIYIGSNSGDFYAIDLATGHVIWKKDLGYVPQLTCQSRGTSASPAVLPDPNTGVLTVYEAGGDGYLYALDAATGATTWKSAIHVHSPGVNDWFDWSSPTVYRGRIFVGLTSQCDKPLTRGGVKKFDQATGKALGTYHATPRGVGGGGVWSSVAARRGSLWATTGTPPVHGKPPGTDAVSIVRIKARTMNRTSRWTVPLAHPGLDQDFGASPVLFPAKVNGRRVELVGAMNKNGIFYAWRAARLGKGPVWKRRIDNPVTPSIPAAVWNHGHRLWIAGNTTTIKHTTYKGSVRNYTVKGKLLWARGLPAAVMMTPALNSSKVLAVVTYDSIKGQSTGNPQDGCYLLNADTGKLLKKFLIGAEFAQPVFVGQYLILATRHFGMYVYHV